MKKQKGRWDLKSGWRLMDRLRDCDSEWELLSQNGFLDLILIIASFITISQLIKACFQIILANQNDRTSCQKFKTVKSEFFHRI